MDRFRMAIDAIDAANAEDPHGKELVYARRMSDRLDRFEPGATEALRLAARAQHIRRWDIPRDSFPNDRKGYLAWRKRLYEYHAELTANILRHAGYDESVVVRVGDLLRKKRLKADPEMQTLEDVICLVFLEHYFDGFIARHEDYDDAKVLNILKRTWIKMSVRGRKAATSLTLSERAAGLVGRALNATEK